jgi:hypothetical protein
MGIRPPRRRNALTKGVRRKMIAIIINIATIKISASAATIQSTAS